jgi:hypothetical protein
VAHFFQLRQIRTNRRAEQNRFQFFANLFDRIRHADFAVFVDPLQDTAANRVLLRLAQAVRAQNDMGCLDAARAFGDRFGAALFEFALALLAVSDALLGASLLFLFGLFFSGLLFFCALSLLLCGFLRGLLCGCCARGIALFGLDALFFVLLHCRLQPQRKEPELRRTRIVDSRQRESSGVSQTA